MKSVTRTMAKVINNANVALTRPSCNRRADGLPRIAVSQRRSTPNPHRPTVFPQAVFGVRLNQQQLWNSVARSRGPCGGSRVIGQSCCTMAVSAIVRTVPPGRGPQPSVSSLSPAPAADLRPGSFDAVSCACAEVYDWRIEWRSGRSRRNHFPNPPSGRVTLLCSVLLSDDPDPLRSTPARRLRARSATARA